MMTTGGGDAALSARPLAARGATVGVLELFLFGWPLLLSGSELLGGDSSRRPFMAIAAVIAGYALFTGLSRRQAKLDLKLSAFAIVFLSMIIVGYFRAPEIMLPDMARYIEAITILLMVMACGAIAMTRFAEGQAARLFPWLLLALPAFIAVNLCFSLTDFQTYAYGTPNQLLSGMGVSALRLQDLPTIHTPNVIGVMAGGSMLLTLCLLWSGGASRWVALALAGPAAVVLLLAETRSALLVSIICLVLALRVSRQALVRITKAALVVGVVSAPLLSAAFEALAGTSLGAALIRESGRAFGVGAGRNYVWHQGLAELAAPNVEQAFGSGVYGQVTTGVLNPVSSIFTGFTTSPTLHNAFLQYIFDVGYIGAAIFLSLIWLLVDVIQRNTALTDGMTRTLLSFLLFIVVCGYTEAVGTLYHFDVFMLLLGIVAFAILLPVAAPAQHQTSRGGRLWYQKA